MPGTDGLQQNVPYPLLSDAPNIEKAMFDMVNALVPLTNLRFANANERAAVMPNPVAGTETFLVAEARKEVFDGESWVPMTPGPWIPLPFITGYNAHSGSPGYRVFGDNVQLRGIFKRTTGAEMNNAVDGWIDFAQLPTAVRPATTKDVTIAVEWRSHNQSARLSVGATGILRIGIVENLTDFPRWASLDGVQFAIGS
jgi:hypothetical protein